MEIWYTAQQPMLFPPLYIMERAARVSHWVILQEAQFDRDNLQYRIAGSEGIFTKGIEVQRVRYDGNERSRFCDMAVADPARWAKKTAFAMQTHYGKQHPYRELRDDFMLLMEQVGRHDSLVTVCTATFAWLITKLDLGVLLHESRSLVPERPKEPTAWMASFAAPLGATDYMQGAKASMAYFVKGPFEDQNVRTWGQDYRRQYRSMGGRIGDPTMSVLDALFVNGVEATRRLLQADEGKGDIGTVVPLVR